MCVYSLNFHIYHISTETWVVPMLAIENSAAMNVGVQISLGKDYFLSFQYILTREIAKSQGSSIFNFLKEKTTFFIVDTSIYIPKINMLFPLFHIFTSNF